MDKKQLIESIGRGRAVVTFTKKDGTKRVMKCTRNWDEAAKSPNYKAPREKTEEEKAAAEARNAVSVWDLEKDAFRSIIPESVEEIVTGEEADKLIDAPAAEPTPSAE